MLPFNCLVWMFRPLDQDQVCWDADLSLRPSVEHLHVSWPARLCVELTRSVYRCARSLAGRRRARFSGGA